MPLFPVNQLLLPTGGPILNPGTHTRGDGEGWGDNECELHLIPQTSGNPTYVLYYTIPVLYFFITFKEGIFVKPLLLIM